MSEIHDSERVNKKVQENIVSPLFCAEGGAEHATKLSKVDANHGDIPLTSVEKFFSTMHVAAKCRYNASHRLKNKSEFSFFVTTVLSLGLMFIPLMQNADIVLAFQNKVLNMIQLFWAVSILVYSIINSKSRYDIRSEKLNICGDKIKELTRKLESEIGKLVSREEKKNFCFEHYHVKYLSIETDFENHTILDYLFVKLEMKGKRKVKGISRILLYARAYSNLAVSYSVPIAMLLFEAIIITDMIKITSILSPYLIKL